LSAGDLFRSLEAGITEDQVQAVMNDTRMRMRAMSELAVGIEVDAIEAGLQKGLARQLAIAFLENTLGWSLRDAY
jgi:hypothetical protein